MKTKLFAGGIAILAVAAIGTLTGRAVWARKHGLVTLNVRNAPLAETSFEVVP